MRILDIIHQEHCLEGSFVYRYLLSGEVTREFAERLGGMGLLKIFDDPGMALFTLRTDYGASVKGMFGARELRAVFPQGDASNAKSLFENQLNFYSGGTLS